jgi:hypothetical protein
MHENRGDLGAIIVDVDGTLIDVEGIRHLVTGKSRNFDAFHYASIDCPPLQHVLDRVKAHDAAGKTIIVVSGRRESFRRLTEFWLAMWECPSDLLLMRDSGDNRPDVEVKREIFSNLPQRFRVEEAIDDRDDLIQLWTDLGIPTVLDAREALQFPSDSSRTVTQTSELD